MSRRTPIGHWMLTWGMAIVLAASSTGCFTPHLWKESPFCEFAEPATDPHLELSQTPQDLLVCYDEVRDRTGQVRRRAYWLLVNEPRVRDGRSPRFVKKAAAGTGEAVAVAASACPESPGGQQGLYALVSTNGSSFVLYTNATQLGQYELPVYQTAQGKTVRVVLTPLAAVGDAVLVVGTLGGILLFLWWEAGGGTF